MHAYLVTGNDKEVVSEKVSELVHKTSEESYEFPIQKIEEVRNLQSFLKLTLAKPTSIVIRDIHNATVEALNAFLKSLEEPQKNVNFILTATSEDKVLPTIVSRCQIIRIKNQESRIGNFEKEEEFLKSPVGEKFAYIDKVKGREEAISFLENVIMLLHDKLKLEKDNFLSLARNLKSAQAALNALSMNGNVTIQMTKFILNTV